MATSKIKSDSIDSIDAVKITTGTVDNARITLDAAEVPNLDASKITAGTIADARFPATLPAASAANLTSIPSANLSGALPAISGASLTGIVAGPTVSASDPTLTTNASLGTQWANSTSGEFYILTDSTTDENVWTNVGEGTGSIAPIPYVGSRGVFAGARAYTNEIEYVTIASDGNGTDFGDLSANAAIHGGGSNVTRGIFGLDRTSGGASNTIEYITVGSTGNSTDFGDATITKQDRGSASNGTRFVMAGGYPAYNTIDYVTITSTGNATDFGDLTVGRQAVCAVSSETRMCFAGGETSP